MGTLSIYNRDYVFVILFSIFEIQYPMYILEMSHFLSIISLYLLSRNDSVISSQLLTTKIGSPSYKLSMEEDRTMGMAPTYNASQVL